MIVQTSDKKNHKLEIKIDIQIHVLYSLRKNTRHMIIFVLLVVMYKIQWINVFNIHKCHNQKKRDVSFAKSYAADRKYIYICLIEIIKIHSIII